MTFAIRATVALWLCLAVQAEAAEPVVCFTPGEDCTASIVSVLTDAKRVVLVQAYSFTSAPIARALVEAHERGIDVRVILDKSQVSERYSIAKFLMNAGIPVWIDDKVAIAHNKVMIIDEETVITGSFNFTRSAQERNAENLLIIRDRDLAAKYLRNWEARQALSRAYRASKLEDIWRSPPPINQYA